MPKKKTQELRLTIRQIRTLQKDHEITNLLNPTGDDGEKISTLDFIVSMYHEGSRHWDSPPSLDDVEDTDLSTLLESVKTFLGSDSEPGKNATT